MESQIAQDVPRAREPSETENEPIHQLSTMSTLHHNDLDVGFLCR